jgi:hypothetical protein
LIQRNLWEDWNTNSKGGRIKCLYSVTTNPTNHSLMITSGILVLLAYSLGAGHILLINYLNRKWLLSTNPL